MKHYTRSSVSSALVLACALVYAASAQADTASADSSGPLSVAQGASAQHFGHQVAANNHRSVHQALIAADVVGLQSQARSGQANAQYAVGMLHAKRRDTAAALYWFQKAALQGHLPAEYSYRAISTAESHAELGW